MRTIIQDGLQFSRRSLAFVGVIFIFLVSNISLAEWMPVTPEELNVSNFQEKGASVISPLSRNSSQIPSKIFRLALPKLDNFPNAAEEMVQRIHDAMMTEFNIAVVPVFTPWARRDAILERGDAELIIKSHATNFEIDDPKIVRVDVPIYQFDDILVTYNDISDSDVKKLGVIRGSITETKFCNDTNCVLANSENQLVQLLVQRRVDAIVLLDVLLNPQKEKLEHLDLRFELLFTHRIHVYFFQQYSQFKVGLEKQFLQYWK